MRSNGRPYQQTDSEVLRSPALCLYLNVVGYYEEKNQRKLKAERA